MKAITICQPYAHLFTLPESDDRHKRIENRTRRCHYRGPLAIHAGKSKKFLRGNNYGIAESEMQFGKIVAVGEVVACFPFRAWNGEKVPPELLRQYPWLYGHLHIEGPYCVLIVNIKPLVVPQAFNGQLGLFEIPDEVIARGAPGSGLDFEQSADENRAAFINRLVFNAGWTQTDAEAEWLRIQNETEGVL